MKSLYKDLGLELQTDGTYFCSGTKGLEYKSVGRPVLLDVPSILPMEKTKKSEDIGASKHFYQNEKVCQLRSSCTKEEIEEIYTKYSINPSEFSPYLPKNRSAMQSHPPFMAVYVQQFSFGLRFPLHPLIVSICDTYCIALPQLAPKSVGYMVAFVAKCVLLDIDPCVCVKIFSVLFQLKPAGSWYYFCKKVSSKYIFDTVLELDNAKSDWHTKFFFVNSNEDLPSVWRVPYTSSFNVSLNEDEYKMLEKLCSDVNHVSTSALLSDENLRDCKIWKNDDEIGPINVKTMDPGPEAVDPPSMKEDSVEVLGSNPIKKSKGQKTFKKSSPASLVENVRKSKRQKTLMNSSPASLVEKASPRLPAAAAAAASSSYETRLLDGPSPEHCEKLKTALDFVDDLKKSGVLENRTLDRVEISTGYDSQSKGTTDSAPLSEIDVCIQQQIQITANMKSWKEKFTKLQDENIMIRGKVEKLAQHVTEGALEISREHTKMKESLEEAKQREKNLADHVKSLEALVEKNNSEAVEKFKSSREGHKWRLEQSSVISNLSIELLKKVLLAREIVADDKRVALENLNVWDEIQGDAEVMKKFKQCVDSIR